MVTFIYPSISFCKTEQKAQCSVYCEKLAVMAMLILTPARLFQTDAAGAKTDSRK